MRHYYVIRKRAFDGAEAVSNIAARLQRYEPTVDFRIHMVADISEIPPLPEGWREVLSLWNDCVCHYDEPGPPLPPTLFRPIPSTAPGD